MFRCKMVSSYSISSISRYILYYVMYFVIPSISPINLVVQNPLFFASRIITINKLDTRKRARCTQ